MACTTVRYAMFTTPDNECRNLRRQLKLIPQGGHDFSSQFTETSLGKSRFRRKRRVISRFTGKKNEKHRNCITRVNLVILMTFDLYSIVPWTNTSIPALHNILVYEEVLDVRRVYTQALRPKTPAIINYFSDILAYMFLWVLLIKL